MYKPFLNPEKYLPATPVEPWRKVLLDAAELIRKRGWAQASFCTPRGEVCALGAINRTHYGNEEILKEAKNNLAAYIGRTTNKPMFSVMSWNDTRGRTADEVISALEAAAKS